MAVKIVPQETIKEILEAIGLKSFARPFAGLIDPGDFGTVATYIPLYSDEYKKLPPHLQAHTYRIAPGRLGIICFLPRTFDAPDGGKATEVRVTHNDYGKIIKVAYTTDRGGEFVTEHTIRHDKLFTYAKNKKLPIIKSVKFTN